MEIENIYDESFETNNIFDKSPLSLASIKSITIVNTGFADHKVDVIKSIGSDGVVIDNRIDCIVDNGIGGTSFYRGDYFEWSIEAREPSCDAYALIVLNE